MNFWWTPTAPRENAVSKRQRALDERAAAAR
jgi:hypothetical protein